MTFVRRARRILSSPIGVPPDPAALWPAQTRSYHQAGLLVRAFYYVQFGLLVDQYHTWAWWMTRQSTAPLWPIAWARYTGMRTTVPIIVGLSLASSLAAAARPDLRSLRVIAAVGMLEFVAFWNSFGAVMHGWHAFVYISAIFTLLPTIRTRPGADSSTLCQRQRYLRVVWYAQLAVLGTYSLSGFFKFCMAIIQIARGQVSALAPDGLARHIAGRLFEGGDTGPQFVGPWLVDHAWVGWPLLVIAIYIEFVSVIVAFRPRLHRAWMIALVGLHLGIYFAMTIMFSLHMIAVGLVLLCSPFGAGATAREIVLSLPIVGDLIARWTRGAGESIRSRRRPSHVEPPRGERMAVPSPDQV